MDNCKDNIEAVSMLIDGELDEAQAASLRAHISECETCKRVYDAFSAISDSLGGDLVEPPEMLAKGVMFKVDLMAKGGAKKRFAYGRFTAIAACLALILFGAGRFGLLSGDVLNTGAKESTDAAAGAETEMAMLQDTTAAEEPAAAGDTAEKKAILENFLLNLGNLDFSTKEQTEETTEEDSRMAQFGLGYNFAEATDGAEAIDEADFVLFLDELLQSADENGGNAEDERFAFIKTDDGERPVELRLYEGLYTAPEEGAAPKADEDTQPLTAFADLKSLRALEAFLRDAEETDKAFDTDPDYTLAVFGEDDTFLGEKVSPLLFWLHDGHLYFKTAPEAKLMRATCKPAELLKFIESFSDEEQ